MTVTDWLLFLGSTPDAQTYVSRDEARHGPNFCEESNLVDLSDHSIHHFAFKGPENNSFVFHWIKNKTSAWLDHTSTNIVNGGDSNYKAISAGKMKEDSYCM